MPGIARRQAHEAREKIARRVHRLHGLCGTPARLMVAPAAAPDNMATHVHVVSLEERPQASLLQRFLAVKRRVGL
jgi:hypothetical protein